MPQSKRNWAHRFKTILTSIRSEWSQSPKTNRKRAKPCWKWILYTAQRIGSELFNVPIMIESVETLQEFRVIAMTVVMVRLLTATLMVLCTVERWSASGRPWVVGSISLATKKREDQTAGNGAFLQPKLRFVQQTIESWSSQNGDLTTQSKDFTNENQDLYNKIRDLYNQSKLGVNHKNVGFDLRETKCPCHNRN